MPVSVTFYFWLFFFLNQSILQTPLQRISLYVVVYISQNPNLKIQINIQKHILLLKFWLEIQIFE